MSTPESQNSYPDSSLTELVQRLRQPWAQPARSAEHEVHRLYALAREAADALERLQADEASLRELLDDARTALSVLQPSCLADEELKEETLAAIDAARSK